MYTHIHTYIGTQIYQRFNPSIMDRCMKHHDAAVAASGTSGKGVNTKCNSLFGGSLYNLCIGTTTTTTTKSTSNTATISNSSSNASSSFVWDQCITPVHLPMGVDIIMGDVHGGTNSPSMAKKVLLWKKQNPIESHALMSKLGDANDAVCTSIKILNEYSQLAGDCSTGTGTNTGTGTTNDADMYNAALLWCNTLPQDQWCTITDEVKCVYCVYVYIVCLIIVCVYICLLCVHSVCR